MLRCLQITQHFKSIQLSKIFINTFLSFNFLIFKFSNTDFFGLKYYSKVGFLPLKENIKAIFKATTLKSTFNFFFIKKNMYFFLEYFKFQILSNILTISFTTFFKGSIFYHFSSELKLILSSFSNKITYFFFFEFFQF